MFITRIYGRKVVPDKVDGGVALDNAVEQVQFIFNREDNAVFLNPGLTAFLKTTSTNPPLKIPLAVESSPTEVSCTWNVLNTQIPEMGIKLAQIQMEIPDLQDPTIIHIWQSEPFQLRIMRTIQVDQHYSELWYDELIMLQERIEQVGTGAVNEVIFENIPVQIEDGILTIPTPSYIWGGNF